MEDAGHTLIMRYTAPDGQGGFPGNVDVTIHISLRDETIQISFAAETDAPTPLSITWHPYFNLSGEPKVDQHIFNQQRLDDEAIDEAFNLPGEGLREIVQFSRGSRALAIFTDYPAVQIYTGDKLPAPRSGFAAEPQFLPRHFNQSQDITLRPNDIYSKVIFYRLELAAE